MTTPPGSLPPRPSVGRSSFAIAMKDYPILRPGIAVSFSAAALVLALFLGFWLIGSLRHAAATVEHGARTVETLHRYNAGLEVWREMATSNDPAFRRPEVIAQRDSMGRALRGQLADLANSMPDSREQELVRGVLGGITSTAGQAGTDARQAMIVLLAKQDSAMFQAAQVSQNAVVIAAALLAVTVLAAGMLVIPMAWLYIRYKRGATIEVKL
jgi:hypothetical protein